MLRTDYQPSDAGWGVKRLRYAHSIRTVARACMAGPSLARALGPGASSLFCALAIIIV